MYEFTDSDTNPTMLASRKFDEILEDIQNSKLNFHLQLSPFSAVISLKKSLIKDRSGVHLKPPFSSSNASRNEIAALTLKNLMLENKLADLHNEF